MKFTKKDKKYFRLALNCLVIIFWAVLVASIFVHLIIPMVFSILYEFIALTELYALLSPTAMFFGGFILLFIFWKIFETICWAWFKIINAGLDWIKKVSNE